MYPTKEEKIKLFSEYAGSETNTGSSEAQIALFTNRIKHLTEHLKLQKKDHSTRLGLIKLVGKRRKLLNYLHKRDIERYRNIISKLNIRR